jgi:hypothetical protein
MVDNNYITHQKYLKYYLERVDGDVLELGVGHGSTQLIINNMKPGRKIISIDNDKRWMNDMVKIVKERDDIKHEYIYTDNWEGMLDEIKDMKFALVFVDQSPWDARIWSLDKFKDTADYIMIHDVDYFPNNNKFGSINKNGQYSFDDKFLTWAYYVLETGGPPTLVGSNTGKYVYVDI